MKKSNSRIHVPYDVALWNYYIIFYRKSTLHPSEVDIYFRCLINAFN